MSQLLKNFRNVTCLLALCCAAGFAQAAPPQTVNFQGRLTDLADNPLNGSFDITFTLYSAASGGVALWTETQTGVAVDNGSVETLLGSVTPIPYSAATSPAAYLQIQVGAETLSPRQPFASVLYSMNSAQLSGRTYDMFMDLSSSQTVTGVKTFGTIIATNSVTAARFYGNGSGLTGIIGDSLGDHTAIAPLDMAGFPIVNLSSLTVSGGVMAEYFVGNGAGLSGISGDNLGSHVASTALDMANFPVNNVSTLTVTNTVMAGKYYGDGSMLTNIRGDSLGNHTAAMPLDMSGQDIIAANNVTAANFYGNGSNLSGIAGDNLGSHTATMALNMGGFPISNAVSLTVSSNVTAGKYFGDGSALTGIAGDNLGSHTASADLNMSGRNIVSVGTVTAANFVGNGSGLSGISGDNLGNHTATQPLNMNGNSIVSVSSLAVAGSDFSVGGSAFAVTGGKAGVGTATPYEMLEIENYGKTVVQVDNGGTVGEAKFRLASSDVEKGFLVYMPELSEIRIGGGVGLSAAFHANNVEIMRLASGGNVGIGNQNPGAKLDIAGNVKITDGTQGAGKVLTSDSSGLASWQAVSGDNLGNHTASSDLNMSGRSIVSVGTVTANNFVGDGAGLSNLNALPKTGGTLTGALNFGGAVPDITSLADEHITIMPAGAGNVGIGEGNPVAKLTVNGDVRATGNLTMGVSGSATLSVGSGAGESVIIAPDNQTMTLKGTRETGLGNAFQVQTYNAAKSSFVDRVTVTGATDTANISMLNSNVGVGTINPANQFVLAHGTGVMNKVFLDGTIDDGGGVIKRIVSLSNTDGSNYGGYLALGNRYSPLTGPADGATVLLSGAPNQNSYISVGNVGVGTTAPNAKLHVAGSVKIADGTQGAGKVLTSDAAGLASWQPSAGDNLGSHIAGTALDMAGNAINNASAVNVSGVITAESFSGNGSGLTGINVPGDNLGNHTAMQDLGMGGFGISSVGNITGSGAVALTAGGIGALDLLAGNTLTPGQTGGAVTIAAGGGYNAPGAGVKMSAGLTSTWSAAGSSAAVVLDGGPSDSPATSAQLKVHGKISSGSGMEYNPGGPVEIIGGNGNAAQGGNIILMPGAGSPDGNVGVGTASPGAKLEVAGNVKIADGTQGAGKVLTSDSAGLASWQTPDFGDNLGSHIAGTNLDMANNAIINAGGVTVNGGVTAESYLTAGTTILAVLNGTGSLGVGGNAGRVNTGLYNSFMGTGAGFANTTGAGNSFVGYHAGYGNIIGGSNTFIGYSAGAAATGTGNIVIGASQDTQSPASNDQMNIGGVLYGDLYGKALGINGYGSKAALTIWPSYISGYNANSQVWNSGAGIAVATMTAGGALHAVSFVGNGSALTNLPQDNLGNHTATQGLNMGNFPVSNLSTITVNGGGLAVINGTASDSNGLHIKATGELVTRGFGNGSYMPLERGVGSVDLQTRRVLGMDNVAAGNYSTIAGGESNKVLAAADHAFIGAGDRNSVSSGQNGVIAGGYLNALSGSHGFVGGGYNNTVGGAYASIGGGQYNTVNSEKATVAGGYQNVIDAFSTHATIPGGYYNSVSNGNYALAAGNFARSNAAGAFTWADSQGQPVDNNFIDRTLFKNRGGFLITGSTNTTMSGMVDRGMFVSGGGLVGIATNNPQAALDVVSFGSGYAQIWRDSSGNVVSSMSASGVLYPQSAPAGDNLGNHTATMALQMGAYPVNTTSNVNAGSYQIAGARVLAVLPGIDSLGVGLGAGQVDTGNNNVFVGYRAGYSNTNGYSNTFLGQNAGYSNTTSENNTFVGQNAGYFNTGLMNSMLGAAAGYSNTTGSYNTLIGDYAGSYNQIGSANALFGFGAGGYGTASINSFSSSTVVGYKAGYMLGNGSANNILVGFQAGDSLTTGANNIIIGYNQDATAPGSSNELNLGGVIYGNLSTGNIGIGVVSPGAKLDVAGNVKIADGTQGAGKVLTSDSSGLASWQTAGGADNLGNHTATMALQMGAYPVNTTSNVNAGSYQIAGARVLAVLPGIDSFAVGLGAGQVDTGNNNVFVGYRAGYSNTNGFSNTFLGHQAGYSTTSGYNNTYVGQNVGYFNTTGIMNSMLGAAAGYANTTGSNNTFMGDYAGNYNQTGSGNALFGFGTGGYGVGSVHSFSSSTVVGYKAGYMLGNGSADNTLIGFQAGDSLTTGSRNIIIGYNQDATAPTISNELNIGGIIWGNLQTGAVGLGLTTTLPQAALDVKSTGTAADQMAQVWRNSGGTIVSSVSATGVVTASKFVSQMGGGTGQASAIGLAGLNLGTQATTGTAEEALLSYTLPANSLNANGKGVRIRAWGTAVNNSMTKILRLRFGGLTGTTVASHTSMSESNWTFEAVVFRTGANTQKGLGFSLTPQETIVSAPAQTDTAAIDVALTGETSITLGEVSAEGLMVEFIN